MAFNRSGPVPGDALTAWTVAMDALAGAGRVAGAATAERSLQDETAQVLTAGFADWAFVDLLAGEPDGRSVAASRPDRQLAAALARMSVRDCPLAMAAISRRTPVIRASVSEAADLGVLPDGRRVLDALRARSYAVGPIIGAGQALGAISIVRCAAKPCVSFRDLGILSQIADLVSAASQRMRWRAAVRPAF